MTARRRNVHSFRYIRRAIDTESAPSRADSAGSVDREGGGRFTPPGWGCGRGGTRLARTMSRDQPALRMPPLAAAPTSVLRLPDGRSESDRLAVEEPLEIRIDGRPIAVTMRTPGHDEELALGCCISEGIPARSARVPDDLPANTVDVEVDGVFELEAVRRNFYTSSSCGVCGKGALEAVAVSAARIESRLRVSPEFVAGLPDRVRA